ncbi:hypothetical protein ACIRF8_12955 [Streptomyces sp. NPDC102406]|uniref:hypothetical protein n=1 Tax=Streptomyces sp. NPDC102406 TaxID=3366171 RepID=UPI00380C5431
MSLYPPIPAGSRITSGLLSSMLPQIMWKTVNTDRAATTAFADDPDLTCVLEANATYHAIFYIHFAALDLARFKTMWNVPSGVSGNRSAMGPDQGVVLSGTSTGGTGRWGVHNFTTSVTYGTRDSGSNQCAAIEEAVFTTTGAGTLALQWAQVTSNATPSRLGAGSSLHLRRLA